MARPVDPVQLVWRGAEIPIADGVVESHFSVARDGTIVYRTAESELAALAWFDRSGARIGTLGDLAEYRHVALSPTGRRVAVARGDPSSADLWTADSTSGVFKRVTAASGAETDPTWSPDERFIAYSYMVSTDVATEKRQPGVRRFDVTSGADVEFVTATCRNIDDWTRDDRVICRKANTLSAAAGSGTGKVTTLSVSGGTDQSHVSPDGSCIAYNSKSSGEWEVYLAPLTGMASATRVSTAGGVQPLWRRDSRELFFMALDGTVMSVPARTGSRCEADTRRRLFKTSLVPAEGWSQYAVTPDGHRFLVMEPIRRFFTLLQNWLPAQREGR